jgi:hypothetical protein
MKRRIMFLAALALSLAAGLAAVALAAKATKATANLEGGNASCGVHEPGDPVIGTASFKRKEDSVTVKVKVTGGEPFAHYEFALYGPGCTLLRGSEGIEVGANKKGRVKITLSTKVPSEDTEFFVDIRGGAEEPVSNRTPYVTLP